MNARMLLVTGLVVALATPVAATARVIPEKHPAKRVAAQVTTRLVAPPRVLCICNPHPYPPPIVLNNCDAVWGAECQAAYEANGDARDYAFEAQFTRDLIAAGLAAREAALQGANVVGQASTG